MRSNDAITIPRADLPEVFVSPGGGYSIDTHMISNGAYRGSWDAYRSALVSLALAEHLRAKEEEAAARAAAIAPVAQQIERRIGERLDDDLVPGGVEADLYIERLSLALAECGLIVGPDDLFTVSGGEAA